jgi:hypothetical protein
MIQVNQSNCKSLHWLLTVLLLFPSNAIYSQTAATPSLGLVEGVVLDQQNKPVSNANVFALLEKDMRKPIAATSDDAGRFSLRDVPIGVIYVFGFKESEGYPYEFYSFYKTPNGRSWVVAEVKPGGVTAGVILHLGPKSAYLKTNVTNGDGNPVPAGYRLDRDDIPGPFQTSVPTDPRLVGVGFINGVMLVPPVPFRLTVQADGFEPWHYGGKNWANKSGLITLKSGQTLILNVKLRKKQEPTLANP